MSTSQDEINTPEKLPNIKQKRKKRNKIASPIDQSPISTPLKTNDVYDLFTVKTLSTINRSDTSEISDDVFTRPKPVTVSSSSTKSYRERINERFKNVKEKAGKSSQKANVFKVVAEKILLEKVRKESENIDAELELMKNKLKLGRIPQNQERYDFFCMEKKNSEIEDNIDDSHLFFQSPKQIGTELKLSEKDCFFVVNRNPVDLENKIENQEPRFLEEEGFYVPLRPEIPSRHECFIEQRLSRDDKKWFNCDGKLLINENPIQQISYRPTIKPLPISATSVYLPAKADYDECEEIIIIKENYLHLQINSLEFIHHPLFSFEHVLAQKLKSLCKIHHNETISSNNLVKLKTRLQGLRQILKKCEETLSQSEEYSDREIAYKRDIKILQKQIFDEGKIEKDRIKTILSTWKAIKQLRETNKYSNTSIKLIIRKECLNYDEDQEEFNNTFEDVYQEILEDKSKTKKRDKEEIKKKLLAKFNESYRMPGEPILRFNLSYDNDITKTPDNTKELTRRNVVASTKILLKILCDKIEVCKTKTCNLGDNFRCDFNETITIQLSTIPKFLTIEVIEQPKSLLKRTLGELSIKLPPQTSSQLLKEKKIFEKIQLVHYKHEGIGSGLRLKEIDEERDINTSGCLEYSIKWETPLHEKEEHSRASNSQLFAKILDKNGGINLDNLSEWVGQFKPDPQDPRNTILYEYAIECNEDDISSLARQQKYFRLNPQMNKWHFCDRSIFEENLRLKILQLRNDHEPEFDRILVPNRIKEIPLDALADYNRRIAKEKEQFVAEDDDDDQQIDSTRSKGKKYLREIYTKVFQRCKNSEHNLTFEDVINEKFLQHFQKLIKMWIGSFLAWFRWHPRPNLQPTLTFPQEIMLSDYELKSQVKLIIDVISALDLSISATKDKINLYIQIEYNNIIAKTKTCQSCQPVWNEKLIIPLESTLTDYLNPNSLNGTILINIFNDRNQILNKFPGEISKDWIGSVEIPLSAVCSDGIQGMFRVKTSHLLFNNKKQDKNETEQKSYLNLNIYMEPNVPKLNPNIEELPCGDLPYIQEYALKWNENFNRSYPHRKFSVFAIDSNATTTCILRYIKPLEPPQINVEGFDVTPEQCARYVSLIPFSDCNQFYKNIWLSVDRFLHFMVGSIFDHAVALTCYFLALKMETWLLLGFGLPYGSAAFVLVKEYDNSPNPTYYIYDVVTSQKISLIEPFCPLQRIYCLVNENNIWANIQRNDDVSTTRFDLNRPSDWLSLFNNKIPAPTNSIHQKIKYIPLQKTDELEIILDRKIRKKFAKLRPLDRTLWNHNVSNIFKRVLDAFERAEMYGKNNLEALEQVKECTARYEIRGQVLCLPFTDISSLIRRVQTLGVHLEEDDNVQFGASLTLKAYPNLVVALWIFIASVKEYKHET